MTGEIFILREWKLHVVKVLGVVIWQRREKALLLRGLNHQAFPDHCQTIHPCRKHESLNQVMSIRLDLDQSSL